MRRCITPGTTKRPRWNRGRFAVLTAALLLGVTGTAHALSNDPADWTPQVTGAGGTVQQIVQCGGSMWAAGDFATVTAVNGTKARTGTFAFNATNGTVWDFAPVVNGPVHTIALSPDCRTAYLGGAFTTVNGSPALNLAAVSAQTGALLPGFAHSANAPVNTLALVTGNLHLLAGGKFTTINGVTRPYLASLNPATGAVESWVNVPISGTYGTAFPTQVYDLKVSHAGTRVLVNGVFTKVGPDLGGRTTHTQVFVLNLTYAATSVSVWDAPQLHANGDRACDTTHTSFYAQGIAWDTADSVLIASTGNSPAAAGVDFCDSLVRLPGTASTLNAPTLVNRTCKDSLYAVSADNWDYRTYYEGGHQRWVDVPGLPTSSQCDPGTDPGGGSVYQPGISAIDRYTGKANPAWHGDTSRGHGVVAIYITAAGGWYVGDAGRCGPGADNGGGELHPGICYFPR